MGIIAKGAKCNILRIKKLFFVKIITKNGKKKLRMIDH